MHDETRHQTLRNGAKNDSRQDPSKSGMLVLSDDEWKLQQPNLKHGGRSGHAAVVLDDHTIVVMGGIVLLREQGCFSSRSVIYLPFFFSSSHNQNRNEEWVDGPSLNDGRWLLTAVVCSGAVYAIGGYNEFNEFNTQFDTIERIPVSEFKNRITSKTDTNDNVWNAANKKWERLEVRLSSHRDGCAAVSVHDRFVIVMGGYGLSSVDVLDTTTQVLSVVAGPEMCLPRRCFGAAVVDDHTIWVVGGQDADYRPIKTAESISFCPEMINQNHRSLGPTSSSSSRLFPPGAKWTAHNTLQLSIARSRHALCWVPGTSCLIVAGGVDLAGIRLQSVEVVDVHRRIVWSLPHLAVPRNYASMVVVVNHDVRIMGGGSSSGYLESIEALPYVETSLTGMETTLRELEVACRRGRNSQEEDQIVLAPSQVSGDHPPSSDKDEHGDSIMSTVVFQQEMHQSYSIGERYQHVQQLYNTLIFYYATTRLQDLLHKMPNM